MNWSNAIKQLRKTARQTQEQLAYDLEVDVTTISRWERGVTEPAVGIQQRLKNVQRPCPLATVILELLKVTDGISVILRGRHLTVLSQSGEAVHYYDDLQGLSLVHDTTLNLEQLDPVLASLDDYTVKGMRYVMATPGPILPGTAYRILAYYLDLDPYERSVLISIRRMEYGDAEVEGGMEVIREVT